jgi:hypothetical protein
MPRPTLFDHPKFHRLVYILGLPEPHVLGHLEFLWRVGYASGNPVVGDELDVELAAKWSGERGALAAALEQVRFIDRLEDGQLEIHDLLENAPKYVPDRAKRESERKRARKCHQCGGEFRSAVASAKFCSDACRTANWRKTNSAGDGPVTEPSVRERHGDAR